MFPFLKYLVIEMAHLGVPLEIWPKDEFFLEFFEFEQGGSERLSFLLEFCP